MQPYGLINNGLLNHGLIDNGLVGPGLVNEFLDAFPPCKDKLVQWWNTVTNGVAIDKIGSSGSEVGREGINGAYFDGDGTRYVLLNSAISYSGEFEIEFNAATINAVGTVAHVLGNVTGNAKVAFLANSDFFVRLFNGGSSDTIANAGSSELKTFNLRRDASNIVYGTVEGVEFTMFGGVPQVGTVTFDTLFASNDSAEFEDKVAYIDLNGIRFNFEESNFTTKVIGTGATPVIGEIQNATGSDRVRTTALESRADIDGYTESDGASYYYDVGLTQLIPSGVIIPTFNGKAMAYTTGGVLADAEFSGELKANIQVVDGYVDNGIGYENWTVDNGGSTVNEDSVTVRESGGEFAYVPFENVVESTDYLIVTEVVDANGSFVIQVDTSNSNAFTGNDVIVNNPVSGTTYRTVLTSKSSISDKRFSVKLGGGDPGEYYEFRARIFPASLFTDPLTDPLPESGQAVSGNSLINQTTKYSVVEADKLTTVQMYDHTNPDAVVPLVVPVDDFIASPEDNPRFSTVTVDNELTQQGLYSETLVEPCLSKAENFFKAFVELTDEGDVFITTEDDLFISLG